MWKLNPTDLLQLKGAGGERFGDFIDRLIRAEAALSGLPQSQIRTQLRVNIRDGGVDTQVQGAFPLPRGGRGWFDVPTCWQFKAEDASAINDKRNSKKPNDLQTEIRKPYAQELIRNGYGYRLCLLGDLTPKKVADWEQQLTEEAKLINPQAPAPRVIHGGDLIPWAETLPAVVMGLRGTTATILHFDAWQQICRAVTPRYVPNPEWDFFQDQIRQHASFERAAEGGMPCLTVGGAAGVGKTRLVFEALNELLEGPGLVVYAPDEQEAVKVATDIVNSACQCAILVADECTPRTRQLLNDTLCRGHSGRIRVVCLDNTGERLASRASQIWLSPDALKNTIEILRENYRDVPDDRRHQYANLAKGFVRLAADMCEFDSELRTGDLTRLLGSVEQYVRNRLQENHLALIALLALFHKVGFRQDVEDDIRQLAAITGVPVQQFHDAVRKVRESPGFVVQAGRYWYVTPDIVARVLFAEGWGRWVSRDPAAFLKILPENLLQQFIQRAGTLGDQEVREQIAAFFRRWINDLTAADLQVSETVTLLESIVEAKPEEHLPRIRSLLEGAGADDIRNITGEGQGRKCGPRRTLVWLLERLVSFPELFDDCEACLFRLAHYESEARIGNNATRIWQGLFSVYLSGTATPFPDRVKIIRQRTSSSDRDELQLVFSGIATALAHATGHVVGPDVVAGKLRPSDWQPKSRDEEKACYIEAINICAEHVASPSSICRQLAVDTLINATSHLLYLGFADELASVLSLPSLSDAEARKVIKLIDEFMHIQEETHRNTNEQSRRYLAKVQSWADSLRPSDFHGVLRSVLSRDPWDDRFRNAIGAESDDLGKLVAEVRKAPALLEPQLDWLASAEATSAEHLGLALGKQDDDFSTGKAVWQNAIAKGSAPLLRGYVRGFVSAGLKPKTEMISLVQQLEERHPMIAVDILSYGGDTFDGFNRVVHLVEANAVPIRALSVFSMGVGERGLRGAELRRLLTFFSTGNVLSDADTMSAGLRFLTTVLHRWSHWHAEKHPFDDEIIRGSAWFLVEGSLPIVRGHLTYDWRHVVADLSKHDMQRACMLLGRALLSENLDLASRAEEQLQEFVSQKSVEVMEGIGAALLDPKEGWRLQVQVLHDIVAKMSPQCVIEWLSHHGLDAARRIARHLPPPFIDEKGEPVVPPVLEAVFEIYHDEKVFENFLTGCHSSEMWWGNGADRFRKEAENARRFLNHSNRWIREWAKHEVSSRLNMAEWEDREHAERFLPS